MFGIDDLGEEHSSIKRYGTEINVGIDTLTQRHQLYTNKGYLTFATSNLNAEMMAKKYGKRIESRMHEMFNIIGVTGNDLRK
jgi:DNA replication protein DnaC